MDWPCQCLASGGQKRHCKRTSGRGNQTSIQKPDDLPDLNEIIDIDEPVKPKQNPSAKTDNDSDADKSRLKMENSEQQPLISHLVELRDRLLRGILAVLIIAVCLLPFANELYLILSAPLLEHLPETSSMIATEVASPFLTPFKLTLTAAIMLAMPVLLYQLWAFIAPGLYKHERRIVFPLMFASTVLFILGILFAYYVVFPLVFGFLTQAAPEGVAVMTDISSYLDFVLKLFFAFGLAFEVPIATLLLIWSGVSTRQSLIEKRPYVIVGAFVIGMLLTPPDVISQTLLAVPVWLLFELGLQVSRLLPSAKDSTEEEELS